MTALVQEMEHNTDDSACLQEQLVLLKGKDLPKISLISAITAMQNEVASVKLKLNTEPNNGATGMKAETTTSRPIPICSYAEHTAISADLAQPQRITQGEAANQINSEALVCGMDKETLLKAEFSLPAHSAAQQSASVS